MRTQAILAALLLALAALFPAPSPAAQADLPLYGEATRTAVLVVLINRTGREIRAIRSRPEADERDFAALPDLLGGDAFEKDARIGVFFEADGAALCAVQLLLDDGRALTLHGFDAARIGEASIRLDEGVAYLTYTDASTGEEVSTLLDELRLLAEAEMDRAGLPEDDGAREDSARGDGDS